LNLRAELLYGTAQLVDSRAQRLEFWIAAARGGQRYEEAREQSA
jgi:hypothetical protein